MRAVFTAIWRALVELTGYLLLVVGLIFLVTPGPGLVIIFFGLTLLAASQIWAKNYLQKLKEFVRLKRK